MADGYYRELPACRLYVLHHDAVLGLLGQHPKISVAGMAFPFVLLGLFHGRCAVVAAPWPDHGKHRR